MKKLPLSECEVVGSIWIERLKYWIVSWVDWQPEADLLIVYDYEGDRQPSVFRCLLMWHHKRLTYNC